MAVCGACGKDMMVDGNSCVSVPFPLSDGKEYEPVPNTDEKCGDCGTPPNGFHHPGCDQERCPKCGSQLIACGCIADE